MKGTPKGISEVGSPSVAPSRSDFPLAKVSFDSQSVTQRALTCANRINLSECISTNLSQQGTPPSIKMVTQSMMALCAAIYIDCGRDVIRLKGALQHIDFIDNEDYANADMDNCS